MSRNRRIKNLDNFLPYLPFQPSNIFFVYSRKCVTLNLNNNSQTERDNPLCPPNAKLHIQF